MDNLSKQKRDALLTKIEEISQYIVSFGNGKETERLLQNLKDIEKEISEKKYGLIFEKHEERIDELLKHAEPYLREEKNLFIANGGETNFLIEGDNLASLQLLKQMHSGRVDVIYIDPPYNTGNKDFVYDDCLVGKSDKYKHSKWLSFMSRRLKLARELLTERGIIFISIDDNEQATLKMLCDSIFNEQNFLTLFVRKTKSMTGDNGNGLNIQHEYLLAYAKNKSKAFLVGNEKTFDGFSNPDNDPNGIWCNSDPSAKSGGQGTYFPIENPITGQIDYPPKGRYWAFSQETLKKYIESGRIKFKDKIIKNQRGFIFKRYAESMDITTSPVCTLTFADNEYMNSVATTETNKLLGTGKFNYPKPMEFIKQIIRCSSRKDSIILDFFAGSGTTGHAVMDLNKEDGGNRTFILCTNNENDICRSVTYERIKKAIELYGYQASLKYFLVELVAKEKK